MMKSIVRSSLLSFSLAALGAGSAMAQDATDPAPVQAQTFDPHYDRQGEIDADQATHDREEASNARRHRDVFFLIPEGGVEIANFATGIAGNNNKSGSITQHNGTVYAAPTFGVDAGFRLSYLNLGVRYQRSWFNDSAVNKLNMNKLYGVVGVTFGKRIVVGQIFAAFGYAFIDQPNASLENGLGGEIGASIDFYVTTWLSLGLQVSVDASGYKAQPSDNLLGEVGGTGLFRLGFHI